MSPHSALLQSAQWWGGAAGPPTLLPCTLLSTHLQEGQRWSPATPMPARPAHRGADGDPPEAVREYTGIMEWLLGPGRPAEGAPGRAWGEDGSEPPQGEEGTYPDPDLLSYIDELCAQEDFITKVWAVLHPRFLANVLSPEPRLDLWDLAEELEQEEGLSLTQLEQKRRLALKQEEGVQAPPSHGTPQLGSRPSETEAGQDTQRNGHGRQQGDSDQAYPPEAGCVQRQRHSLADAGMSRPKAFAASPGRRGCPPLKADWPHPALQARWHYSHNLGPSLSTARRKTCPAREPLGPTDRPSEDEGELPSLAFLLSSQHILPSWDCPRVLLQAWTSSALEYPGPTLPRGQASAPLALQLPRPAVGPVCRPSPC
ncbi:hypothetical protein MC885_020454 [Smutsia gigantea]|nr:hypothetical protein MC885_020454 [Smutsia gigantea]